MEIKSNHAAFMETHIINGKIWNYSDKINENKVGKLNKSGILADISFSRQKIELYKIEIIIDLISRYRENKYSNTNKKENHRSLLLREELYASRHSIEGLQKRLQLKDVDKASDGIKLASNRALPSTPVSSQKREYLETVRAELNTIRSVAESKLGLLENC